jgi:hypothetical protein
METEREGHAVGHREARHDRRHLQHRDADQQQGQQEQQMVDARRDVFDAQLEVARETHPWLAARGAGRTQRVGRALQHEDALEHLAVAAGRAGEVEVLGGHLEERIHAQDGGAGRPALDAPAASHVAGVRARHRRHGPANRAARRARVERHVLGEVSVHRRLDRRAHRDLEGREPGRLRHRPLQIAEAHADQHPGRGNRPRLEGPHGGGGRTAVGARVARRPREREHARQQCQRAGAEPHGDASSGSRTWISPDSRSPAR